MGAVQYSEQWNTHCEHEFRALVLVISLHSVAIIINIDLIPLSIYTKHRFDTLIHLHQRKVTSVVVWMYIIVLYDSKRVTKVSQNAPLN